MKKIKSIKKLNYDELSFERKKFSDILNYILERVYDPYITDDQFISYEQDGTHFDNYYFSLLTDKLGDL